MRLSKTQVSAILKAKEAIDQIVKKEGIELML